MLEEPITAAREDESNPFAPPQSDLSDHWGIGDPQAEALRRVHIQEESYVKALAIVNFVYVFWFGAVAANLEWILFAHLRGGVSAPWIVRPGYVAMQVVSCGLPIFALGAALGFFRRRSWALRFELLTALCLLLSFALDPLIRSTPTSALLFIASTALVAALAAPMLNVWDLRRSAVFTPEYALAVAATPHIKARPKLSVGLTLSTVVLFLVATGLGIYSQADQLMSGKRKLADSSTAKASGIQTGFARLLRSRKTL